MRIWQVLKVSQESKDWIADPANRVCDAPGSWYCRGQYPPKLGKLMQRKRDFKQLEDFNVKKDEKSKKYEPHPHPAAPTTTHHLSSCCCSVLTAAACPVLRPRRGGPQWCAQPV